MNALAFLFSILAVSLLLNVPLAFGLGIASVSYLLVFDAAPVIIAAQRTVAGIDSFTLLAIPLFILAGATMSSGGLTRRIVDLCSALVGSFRGGLALVAVLAAMLFGALSGSGVADVTAIGALMLPHMRRAGYDQGFSCALIGCAGSLGTVLPPSIVFIVYGAITGTSIGALFVGGIVPGVLSGAGLMAVAYFTSRKHAWGGEQPFDRGTLWRALKGSWLALLAPVIIVGGIRSGVFTPTEAAAIAFVYALVIGVLVYRSIDLREIWSNLADTAETSSTILLIIANASVFGWILAAERVPQAITTQLSGMTDDPLITLILINLVVLVLGTFMEAIALIIILVPLFMPLIGDLGVSPVHFGVMLALNLAIGANTPPLGIDLLAACRVGGIDVLRSLRPLIPFLGIMIAVLFLVAAFPGLVLW